MSVKKARTGVWISSEILDLKDLKIQYRIFLAEIDNLDNGCGCVAENEHFSTVFGLSKTSKNHRRSNKATGRSI